MITRQDRVGPIAKRHLTNHSMRRPNPHLWIKHTAHNLNQTPTKENCRNQNPKEAGTQYANKPIKL
jgi:hypothetical protein